MVQDLSRLQQESSNHQFIISKYSPTTQVQIGKQMDSLQESQKEQARKRKKSSSEEAFCRKCKKQIPFGLSSAHERICNPEQHDRDRGRNYGQDIPLEKVYKVCKPPLQFRSRKQPIISLTKQEARTVDIEIIEKIESMAIDDIPLCQDLELDMIPCESCGLMLLFTDLQQHQGECLVQPFQQCIFCLLEFPIDTFEQHEPICPVKRQLQRETEAFNQQNEVRQSKIASSIRKQTKPIATYYKSSIPPFKSGGKNQKEKVKVNVLKKEGDCSICFAPIRGFQKVYDLKCSHKFHEKCLDPWLKEQTRCPMCKKPIQSK